MKIRQFKKFWQMLDDNGQTVFQSTQRSECQAYCPEIGMCLYGMKDPMRQPVYQKKEYRDKRHFVRN